MSASGWDYRVPYTGSVEATLTRMQEQGYPVYVAFVGDSPIEYPSEDESEEPEPFDQAAVNTAMAVALDGQGGLRRP